MPLEVYRMVRGRRSIGYAEIPPGRSEHIVFINSSGDQDIMVFGCAKDDQSSYIQVIHPMAIMEKGHPPFALIDEIDIEPRDVFRRGEVRDFETIILGRKRGKLRVLDSRFHLFHR